MSLAPRVLFSYMTEVRSLFRWQNPCSLQGPRRRCRISPSSLNGLPLCSFPAYFLKGVAGACARCFGSFCCFSLRSLKFSSPQLNESLHRIMGCINVALTAFRFSESYCHRFASKSTPSEWADGLQQSSAVKSTGCCCTGPGLVYSNHVVAHNCLALQFQGDLTSLSRPHRGVRTCIWLTFSTKDNLHMGRHNRSTSVVANTVSAWHIVRPYLRPAWRTVGPNLRLCGGMNM